MPARILKNRKAKLFESVTNFCQAPCDPRARAEPYEPIYDIFEFLKFKFAALTYLASAPLQRPAT